MYYTYPCTYCGKIFYAFDDNKERAAHTLYRGIKEHLKEYGEDDKEYKMDDGEKIDSDMIYREMTEYNEAPSGGYPVE